MDRGSQAGYPAPREEFPRRACRGGLCTAPTPNVAIPASRSHSRCRPKWRRAAVSAALAVYCIGIFAVLDFLYSSFLRDSGLSPHIPSASYHHGLLRNFSGYDSWGDHRYTFYTNSLGFRDGAVRDVAKTSPLRRILLIGDSFTEGTGVTFEQSFAGLLQAAGLKQPANIEFLDAGVISYSPSLYFRKVKALLGDGLRFDEVVLFSDVSDVRDEATKYFCHDDDPRYARYCDPSEREFFASLCKRGARSQEGCEAGSNFAYVQPGLGAWVRRHFAMSDSLRLMAKFAIQSLTGNQKNRVLNRTPETAWVFGEPSDSPEYAPLGPEGGIARSLKNMQALADLLKANHIPLTIVVYPWPAQIALHDRDSRQVQIWRDFCAANCKAFINLFPLFFDAAAARDDWYETYFIFGDFHYSPAGHRLMYRGLAERLLAVVPPD